jgi:hypothetical protein
MKSKMKKLEIEYECAPALSILDFRFPIPVEVVS